MYKVFVNERPFVLNTQAMGTEGIVDIQYQGKQQLLELYQQLKKGQPGGVCVFAGDIEPLKEAFFSLFTIIEAAGGVVINPQGKYLFIKRNGFWDLPKGKLDEGETIEECAIREVEEECGIDGLAITASAGATYHTYEMKGKEVLKISYWYLMNTGFTGTLVPQTEEGITEVRWMDRAEVASTVLANTFSSIGELVRREIL